MFQSYEESTALVSSEASTTEASTLNPKESALPELPADLPLDLPHDELNSSADNAAEAANVNNEALVSTDRRLSVGATAASNETSLSSPDSNSNKLDKQLSPGPSVASSSGKSEKRSEDDADTGIFLSSGSSAEIRDLVSAALSNDDQLKSETSDLSNGQSPELSSPSDNLPQNGEITKETLNYMQIGGTSSNDVMLNSSTTAQSRSCKSNEMQRNSEGCGNRSSRSISVSGKPCLVKCSNKASIESNQTAESSAAANDSSCDSSPEPLVPAYEGIFPSDSGN